MKFSFFSSEKNLCILHGQVFLTFRVHETSTQLLRRSCFCYFYYFEVWLEVVGENKYITERQMALLFFPILAHLSHESHKVSL